jgi:rod shape-determining protein MreB
MFTQVFSGVLDAFSQDLAIDMGTGNTYLHVAGRGVVCREPTVVAVFQNRRGERQVIAVGTEAKAMLGRTPSDIQVVRPVRDGVIADFEIAEALLRHLLHQVVGQSPVVRPNAMVCIPYGTTEVEKRAMRESAESAGVRHVHLVEEPIAAAVGLGMNIAEAQGNMVVDVGAGTTEISVLSMSDIVYARTLRVAGDVFDDALARYLRVQHGLFVGPRTAEALKIQLGSAVRPRNPRTLMVKGRDLSSGFPRALEVHAEEVYLALMDSIHLIVEGVLGALEKTPPELAGDIVDRGIVLTGGGAMLQGLDRALREATGIPVILAEDPMAVVVTGCARAMETRQEVEVTGMLRLSTAY